MKHEHLSKIWNNDENENEKSLYVKYHTINFQQNVIFVLILEFSIINSIINNIYCLLQKNSVFESAPRKWVPPGLDPYPSRSNNASRICQELNVFGPKHVRAGRPTDLVQVDVHLSNVATRALLAPLHLGGGYSPLLPQVSKTT